MIKPLTLLLGLTPLALSSSSTARQQSDRLAFPEGFDWCVSTAAHQIEGNNFDSDWWHFEQQPGRIARGERSGRASNSWELTGRDLQILQELNATQYRFSIEWARIEPRQGQFDGDAIEHYRRFVAELESRGISPMITLQHFTLPQWMRGLGGWEWAGSADAFAQFTRIVRDQIAPKARDFVTINEPMVNLLGGYFLGAVPPAEKRSLQGVVAPILGMLRAHAASYRVLHEGGRPVRVGMAHHLRPFEAAHRLNPLDHLLARVFDQAWNWALPNALETGTFKLSIPGMIRARESIEGLAGTQDFFGLNYYTREKVDAAIMIRTALGKATPEDQRRTEAMYWPEAWESYPKGLESLLLEVHRRYPRHEIRITENGVADPSDSRRPQYLRDHLQAIYWAIKGGAPVRGYCHWSMIDNFEWVYGFKPRFGLYEVDYTTFERRPRASARQFSEYASQNAVW